MGFVFLFATSVVLIVFRPTFSDMNCEEGVHVNCPSIALYNTIRESAGIISENMLFEHCSDILEDITCKGNYLNACDHENYLFFSLMTNGLKELFTELCNETSYIRKGYVKHLDCFKRSSIQFRICHFYSLEVGRRTQSRNTESQVALSEEEQQIATICSFEESFRSCTTNVVRNSCSEEAATYWTTLYSMALQGLVSELCK